MKEMSIDDPLAAAEQVLANEERARSPVLRYASKVIGVLPSPVAEAVSKALESDSVGKLEYMTEVLKSEFSRVRSTVEKLSAESDEHRRFCTESLPELMLDGYRKAERTRAKDRIRRIAAILVNASATVPPRMLMRLRR